MTVILHRPPELLEISYQLLFRTLFRSTVSDAISSSRDGDKIANIDTVERMFTLEVDAIMD